MLNKKFEIFCSFLLGDKSKVIISDCDDLNDFDQLLISLDSQLFESKLGYPLCEVMSLPELENQFTEICKKRNIEPVFKNEAPRMILTHDVDYIQLTIPYLLKTILGRRKVKILKNSTFLDSLEEILMYEKENSLKSICFIPTSGCFFTLNFKKWIINPSYRLNSKYGKRLKSIMTSNESSVGLHGSIGSLKNGILLKEKETLESWLGTKVFSIRQHWLDIPSRDYFEIIKKMGFIKDFTLGWNGRLGFRTGFLRSIPIILSDDEYIEAQPLSIMDGVLFDELNLTDEEAFQKGAEIIDIVFAKNGDLVLNWHGRSFAKEYNWGAVYKRLVEYALNKGFVCE